MKTASSQQLTIAQLDARDELISLALALGSKCVDGWSDAEEALTAGVSPADPSSARAIAAAIESGRDPFGERFCEILTAEERRPMGATYTPQSIVTAMTRLAANSTGIDTVIDPGAGSARFLVAMGRLMPKVKLIGVEIDPFSAILARGHIAAAGLADRATVVLGDYRDFRPASATGKRLFLGNPPYVRHHVLSATWKQWLVEQSCKLGVRASRLAGLHAYFFVATALNAHDGDAGLFITSAEWMDVNYGRLIRELLLETLGLESLHLLDADVIAFPDAATTAVITSFSVGRANRTIGITRVTDLPSLDLTNDTRSVSIEEFRSAGRWTPIVRSTTEHREGFVELGEICRVHRGQVTGANKVWIEGPHSLDLPQTVLFRSVTKARDLFSAGDCLLDGSQLRRVIDLPVDLDTLPEDERIGVERFLKLARQMGADSGYIAQNRRAWWSVGLREPAPILATYMARRPPAFVLNGTRARHINVAHGLYPRTPLSEASLLNLAHYLSKSVDVASGRTYAGGLTKFEPKEMERLLVPHPDVLSRNEAIARSS